MQVILESFNPKRVARASFSHRITLALRGAGAGPNSQELKINNTLLGALIGADLSYFFSESV